MNFLNKFKIQYNQIIYIVHIKKKLHMNFLTIQFLVYLLLSGYLKDVDVEILSCGYCQDFR